MRSLNLLGAFAQCFDEIFISQIVVDEIRNSIALQEYFTKKGMTIWEEGGKLYRAEIRTEDTKRNIDTLKKTYRFLIDTGNIQIVGKSVERLEKGDQYII